MAGNSPGWHSSPAPAQRGVNPFLDLQREHYPDLGDAFASTAAPAVRPTSFEAGLSVDDLATLRPRDFQAAAWMFEGDDARSERSLGSAPVPGLMTPPSVRQQHPPLGPSWTPHRGDAEPSFLAESGVLRTPNVSRIVGPTPPSRVVGAGLAAASSLDSLPRALQMRDGSPPPSESRMTWTPPGGGRFDTDQLNRDRLWRGDHPPIPQHHQEQQRRHPRLPLHTGLTSTSESTISGPRATATVNTADEFDDDSDSLPSANLAAAAAAAAAAASAIPRPSSSRSLMAASGHGGSVPSHAVGMGSPGLSPIEPRTAPSAQVTRRDRMEFGASQHPAGAPSTPDNSGIARATPSDSAVRRARTLADRSPSSVSSSRSPSNALSGDDDYRLPAPEEALGARSWETLGSQGTAGHSFTRTDSSCDSDGDDADQSYDSDESATAELLLAAQHHRGPGVQLRDMPGPPAATGNRLAPSLAKDASPRANGVASLTPVAARRAVVVGLRGGLDGSRPEGSTPAAAASGLPSSSPLSPSVATAMSPAMAALLEKVEGWDLTGTRRLPLSEPPGERGAGRPPPTPFDAHRGIASAGGYVPPPNGIGSSWSPAAEPPHTLQPGSSEAVHSDAGRRAPQSSIEHEVTIASDDSAATSSMQVSSLGRSRSRIVGTDDVAAIARSLQFEAHDGDGEDHDALEQVRPHSLEARHGVLESKVADSPTGVAQQESDLGLSVLSESLHITASRVRTDRLARSRRPMKSECMTIASVLPTRKEPTLPHRVPEPNFQRSWASSPPPSPPGLLVPGRGAYHVGSPLPAGHVRELVRHCHLVGPHDPLALAALDVRPPPHVVALAGVEWMAMRVSTSRARHPLPHYGGVTTASWSPSSSGGRAATADRGSPVFQRRSAAATTPSRTARPTSHRRSMHVEVPSPISLSEQRGRAAWKRDGWAAVAAAPAGTVARVAKALHFARVAVTPP